MTNLRDSLNEKTMLLKVSAGDWEEAVVIGGQLLVDVGAVEPRYIDAIIRFTREYGPYYVIAPGLAMPHARPEDGVLETCFSLVTLKEPVEFGNKNNDPVDVLIFLSAVDNTSHIEAIKQVVTLFSNQQNFEKIRKAAHYSEVLELLEEMGATENITN
jgi:PTS system ascorbate-specific IIA component